MSIKTPAASGPLPDGPPHRQAGPGAARDHVRRLHQDGRTYQVCTVIQDEDAGVVRGEDVRA